MKRFRVERVNQSFASGYEVMIVTLHNPPFENENILHKTKWNIKDCTITDITPKFQGEE